MKRRELFKKTGLASSALALNGIGGFATRSLAQTSPSAQSALSLSLSLTTPGRVGFYKDYSELESVGSHRFYVNRTHGSQGRVSVKYVSFGDNHSPVEGVLTWDESDMSIKAIDIRVSSKTKSGEHRIVVRLFDPSGNNGAPELQYGEQTVAYGVIDDLTVASDAEAIFFDADASTNGDGKAATPYNNVYDAFANTAGKRFVYGRGTMVVNDRDKVGAYSTDLKGIKAPPTRTSELDRLVISAWPTNGARDTLTITGDGTKNTFGIMANKDQSFHTYRNIKFSDLDSSGMKGNPCAGLWYHYGECVSITVEGCAFNNISGARGTNVAGYSPYGVVGGKVWRCEFDNISVAESDTQQNAAGILSYDGDSISVQRCVFRGEGRGVYHKRIRTETKASISCKFNVFYGTAVYYSVSGSSNPAHRNTIVQSNVFIGNGRSDYDGIAHQTSNPDEIGGKHWWCNNVFYQCGTGENGAINFTLAHQVIIFNNIFFECRRAWRESKDFTENGCRVEFADYNQVDLGGSSQPAYELGKIDYSQAALVVATSASNRPSLNTLARNDDFSKPQFVNAPGGNFSLRSSSPALRSGVDATDKGYLLLPDDVIGTDGTVTLSDERQRPRKMAPISVEKM